MTAQSSKKITGYLPTSCTPAGIRGSMGAWELSAETEKKVKSGTIAASFPSTILLMLLRPDTRDASVIHTGWKQARDKKMKGCGKIQNNSLLISYTEVY